MRKKLTILDAAEEVLRTARKALHYKDLADKVRERGVETKAKDFPNTLYASISLDIKRRTARGEDERFVLEKSAFFGLAIFRPEGVRRAVARHNEGVLKKLLDQIKSESPSDFEETIKMLLQGMGYVDVKLTPRSHDGGIDVRATLITESGSRIQFSIQAKRYDKNVGPDVVRELRGSIRPHDRALIITTSKFTSGAQKEAKETDKAPVDLLNGTDLARLLARYELKGVTRESIDFFTIAQPETEDG